MGVGVGSPILVTHEKAEDVSLDGVERIYLPSTSYWYVLLVASVEQQLIFSLDPVQVDPKFIHYDRKNMEADPTIRLEFKFQPR